MEGLIPYVCRVIKRKRTRRYYKCLSVGPSHTFYQSQSPSYLPPPPPPPQHQQRKDIPDRFHDGHGDHHHRRYRSMEDFSTNGNFSPEQYVEHPPRMTRGRSVRVLACITG